jgi:type II secretory pathway pseudopilin PulG
MHPPSAHAKPASSAFTLAEVMMATVVLLIAVVGLFEAVTVGAGMVNVARKQQVAMQIIRAEIEAVHVATWPATGPTDGTTPGTPIRLEDVALGTLGYPELMSLKNVGKGFTLSRTIVPIKAPPNWLKKITFTVTWSETNGRSYTRTGYTYCGKNGVNALYQR